MSEQTLTKQADEKFCGSCGAVVKIAAEICPKCGVRQNAEQSKSSWKVLFYLSMIIGYFGADRFYVGKIGTGILKLITIGGFGIWWIIDIIIIASGKFTDASGKFVEKQGEKVIKHFGIGIGIIIVLAAFGQVVSKDSQSSLTVSDNGTVSRPAKNTKVPVAELSASQLFSEYEDNEVAADNAYKGKWIKVSGTVESIAKDILDDPYVLFNTGDLFGVQVYFDDASQLGSIKKGQRLTIVGKCDGKFGNILVKYAFFE
ncbi:MAG: NINE protein [Fibromonadaceae bacterium]|nr:NINE protein [Fibromonadaceae bacterium]